MTQYRVHCRVLDCIHNDAYLCYTSPTSPNSAKDCNKYESKKDHPNPPPKDHKED